MILKVFDFWMIVPSRTAEDFPDRELTSGLLYPSNCFSRFGIGSCLGIILDHTINRMIEGDQQRHIARDDLRQHAHSGADLRGSALIS